MKIQYAILVGLLPFIITLLYSVAIYKFGIYAFIVIMLLIFIGFVIALTKMN